MTDARAATIIIDANDTSGWWRSGPVEERRAGDFSWTVCTDPEGNEFCVAAE